MADLSTPTDVLARYEDVLNRIQTSVDLTCIPSPHLSERLAAVALARSILQRHTEAPPEAWQAWGYNRCKYCSVENVKAMQWPCPDYSDALAFVDTLRETQP